MFQLHSQFRWFILPCLLSLGFTSAQGVEEDLDNQEVLSYQDFSIDNVLRSKSSRKKNSVAYGSFFSNTSQTLFPAPVGISNYLISFPNSSVKPKHIESSEEGTLFTIKKDGVYEITYSFSLPIGTHGITGSIIALDIDQGEFPVEGSEIPLFVFSDTNLNNTIQLFLKKGQTISVNLFSPNSVDNIIIGQANITFNLIDSNK